MRLLFALLLVIPVTGFTLLAQNEPLSQELAEVTVDSGRLTNTNRSRNVIFEDTVYVPEASWIRLRFDEILLGRAPRNGDKTVIRITSLLDQASQTMNSRHVQEWGYTSAYFNGDAVRIELIADPSAEPSRVRISQVMRGIPNTAAERSICGNTDDRVLSFDDRIGRLVPVGCTGWLFNQQSHCLLTAGHCIGGSEVLEFNVPLSSSTGAINHPGPEDQYAIDPASIQGTNGGVSNDWAYMGAFANTETGLTPLEAQGASFTLADPPPSPVDQNIIITGYGSTSAPLAPLEWYLVQKTHEGPFNSILGNTLRYSVDTTGGNSGGPVIHSETGNAIGIHTHAGCDSGGNQGTNSAHADLQTALENPMGICAPPPPLSLSFGDDLPDLVDPDGGSSILVTVQGANGGTPQSGTGMFNYDIGNGLVSAPMIEVSPNQYRAEYPVVPCGSLIHYEFTAQADDGTVVTYPTSSPDQRYQALAAHGRDVTFYDNFESDMGWTVENSAGLTDGAWVRGLPMGGGLRGDPPYDADASGNAFLTNNLAGNTDVDGGSTTLISPIMDVTQGDAYITYWRWYDTSPSTTIDDTFVIDISSDGGNTWTNLETIGPTGPGTTGGWIFRSVQVSTVTEVTDQFRIRFIASDTGEGSVVEAGVDGVSMRRSAEGYLCIVPCFGEITGDSTVDESDFLALVAEWTQGELVIDLNEDGSLDLLDLLVIRDAFGECQ